MWVASVAAPLAAASSSRYSSSLASKFASHWPSTNAFRMRRTSKDVLLAAQAAEEAHFGDPIDWRPIPSTIRASLGESGR